MGELTRGWIWQELAYSKPTPTCKKSPKINLLVELVQGGSEMIRSLLPGGYSPPTNMGSDDLIKFAIDCLWRVRAGDSDETGIEVFTHDSPHFNRRFEAATARVRQLRHSLGTDKTARALAALENLESSNFTHPRDLYEASFATYKQLFEMDDGQLASFISNDLPLEARRLGLDYEVWQQPTVSHPLAFLCGVAVSTACLTDSQDVILTVRGRAHRLGVSWFRALHRAAHPKLSALAGRPVPVLSANYRVCHGRTYLVGVNLANHLRLVLAGSLDVTGGGCAPADAESKWSSATWQSGDAEWADFVAARGGVREL